MAKYVKKINKKGEEVIVKKGGFFKKALIVMLVLAGLGSILGNSGSKTETPQENTKVEQEAENKEEIKYEKATVDQMVKELEENAMNCGEKYQDKYLELTGKVSVIDSDGKYFSLAPIEKFSLDSVRVDVNKDQKDTIKKIKSNQKITVKVKITDIGEIMGFAGDLQENIK